MMSKGSLQVARGSQTGSLLSKWQHLPLARGGFSFFQPCEVRSPISLCDSIRGSLFFGNFNSRGLVKINKAEREKKSAFILLIIITPTSII